MATKTIAWDTGSGNITLTYTGQGNGSVFVMSDPNDSQITRSKTITIKTTLGAGAKVLSVIIKQDARSKLALQLPMYLGSY
jgi:alcohol dehydrogenase class IV